MPPGAVTTSVVATTLSVVLLPQVLLLLCTAQGRKNAYIAVETVLASVLVVLLLAIVLGLPIGAPLLAASPARALRARRALHCICSLHAFTVADLRQVFRHSAEDGRRPIHGMRRSTTMHSCTGALRAMTGSAPRPCAGAVYLLLKAVSYFVGSFLSLPAVAGVLAALRSKAGL